MASVLLVLATYCALPDTLAGLRCIPGHGGGARARAKQTRWAVGSFHDGHGECINVALQPHRMQQHGMKFVFHRGEMPRAPKLAYLLVENSEEDGHPISIFKGMYIEREARGQGLSKSLIALWLHVCVVCSITPRAAQINKPLLSHVLEKHFGFIPDGGVKVARTAAVRRSDCVLTECNDPDAVCIHTGFSPPPLPHLRRTVHSVLGSACVLLEVDAPALRSAIQGQFDPRNMV